MVIRPLLHFAERSKHIVTLTRLQIPTTHVKGLTRTEPRHPLSRRHLVVLE